MGDNYYSGSRLKLSVKKLDKWYWKDPNRFFPIIRVLLSKTI